VSPVIRLGPPRVLTPYIICQELSTGWRDTTNACIVSTSSILSVRLDGSRKNSLVWALQLFSISTLHSICCAQHSFGFSSVTLFVICLRGLPRPRVRDTSLRLILWTSLGFPEVTDRMEPSCAFFSLRVGGWASSPMFRSATAQDHYVRAPCELVVS
jgi:hypothetical protein